MNMFRIASISAICFVYYFVYHVRSAIWYTKHTADILDITILYRQYVTCTKRQVHLVSGISAICYVHHKYRHTQYPMHLSISVHWVLGMPSVLQCVAVRLMPIPMVAIPDINNIAIPDINNMSRNILPIYLI